MDVIVVQTAYGNKIPIIGVCDLKVTQTPMMGILNGHIFVNHSSPKQKPSGRSTLHGSLAIVTTEVTGDD